MLYYILLYLEIGICVALFVLSRMLTLPGIKTLLYPPFFPIKIHMFTTFIILISTTAIWPIRFLQEFYYIYLYIYNTEYREFVETPLIYAVNIKVKDNAK